MRAGWRAGPRGRPGQATLRAERGPNEGDDNRHGSCRQFFLILSLGVHLGAVLDFVARRPAAPRDSSAAALAASHTRGGCKGSAATGSGSSLLRAAIRNSTRQCGRTYFDVYDGWAVTGEPAACPDIHGAIAGAQRRAPPDGWAGAAPWLEARFAPPAQLPGCRLRWFTATEACDLIEESGHLVLVGDSLVRHIATALYGLLTSNYRYGGIVNAAHQLSVYEACQCDGQYGAEPQCHSSPGMVPEWPEITSDVEPAGVRVCPKWATNRLHFLPAFGDMYPSAALERILSLSRSATVYQSNGLGYIPPASLRQDRLDTAEAYMQSWGKLVDLTARFQATRAIFGTVLAHNGRRPCQTRAALDEYNAWLRLVAANNSHLGIEVLEGRTLMEGLPSRDSVHFSSHDNVFLAQVLLNVLAAGPQKARNQAADMAHDRSAQWRDFPASTLSGQDGIPLIAEPWMQENGPETSWFVDPEYDLRRCRCFKDWRARQHQPVCHCGGGWCPAIVTPHTLTYNTEGCGVDLADTRQNRTCFMRCASGPDSAPLWVVEECRPTGADGVNLGDPLPCPRPMRNLSAMPPPAAGAKEPV